MKGIPWNSLLIKVFSFGVFQFGVLVHKLRLVDSTIEVPSSLWLKSPQHFDVFANFAPDGLRCQYTSASCCRCRAHSDRAKDKGVFMVFRTFGMKVVLLFFVGRSFCFYVFNPNQLGKFQSSDWSFFALSSWKVVHGSQRPSETNRFWMSKSYAVFHVKSSVMLDLDANNSNPLIQMAPLGAATPIMGSTRIVTSLWFTWTIGFISDDWWPRNIYKQQGRPEEAPPIDRIPIPEL